MMTEHVNASESMVSRQNSPNPLAGQANKCQWPLHSQCRQRQRPIYTQSTPNGRRHCSPAKCQTWNKHSSKQFQDRYQRINRGSAYGLKASLKWSKEIPDMTELNSGKLPFLEIIPLVRSFLGTHMPLSSYHVIRRKISRYIFQSYNWFLGAIFGETFAAMVSSLIKIINRKSWV